MGAGMCGRYKQFAGWEEIYDYFNLLGTPRNIPARYNIAPTQDAPIVRSSDEGLELLMARWELIPACSERQRPHYNKRLGSELVSGLKVCNAAQRGRPERPQIRSPWNPAMN